MTAVDPTYPLYPISCILSAGMLLSVLLTSFIRKSWNLGVAFLCFWLFVENLTAGINAIIWTDNASVRLNVYCDIYSRVELVASVVKPVATLIITRRLYLITHLRSVAFPDQATKHRDFAIECTLGLMIPVLVAGPLYYVVQRSRFQVIEGFGCTNASDGSILSILLLRSWSVIPPLVSILVYYPRVVRTFYRQSQDVKHFLQSNNSVSHTNYFRVLVLASIDILLTLPMGIASIALFVPYSLDSGSLPFYPGWTQDHTTWEPRRVLYADLVARGTSTLAEVYFAKWTSPFLAFVIFGLFGVAVEARASYWRVVCTVAGWFGWKPILRKAHCSSMGDIEFGERPDSGLYDPASPIRSQLGSISINMSTQDQGIDRE